MNFFYNRGYQFHSSDLGFTDCFGLTLSVFEYLERLQKGPFFKEPTTVEKKNSLHQKKDDSVTCVKTFQLDLENKAKKNKKIQPPMLMHC